MRRRFPSRRLRLGHAFTLIELLVVIVILGILMAVAVPTFLRQQSKAQDSRTQQYLTTAFKAIRSGTPDTSNQYPVATTMVSWVQQSEPELTVQRGSCVTAVQTAPQDAVLVDPASTPTALTLCARSQSGNVFKLTATNTGVQQLLDGTLVALTEAGGLVTDATRSAQGDGLSNDSSTGVWETTTNPVTNGGFETNTTGWSIFQPGTTITRITTDAKFGTASASISLDGTTNYQGVFFDYPYTAGLVYTLSGWVKGPAGDKIAIGYSAASTLYTLTGSWQRITYTWTAASGDNRIYFTENTLQQTMTFLLDGVQIEQKNHATPYVETNGATASRAAASVNAPSSLLNDTQGWVAMRVRVDANPVTRGALMNFFTWNMNNHIVRWLPSGGTGVLRSENPNSGGHADVTTPLTPGLYTIIGYWTTTQLGISLNGGSFVTAARGAYVSTPDTLFDIGGGASYPTDSDILWFACGGGTLSNADATTISGFGDNDPKVASFPAAAQATMVWNGVGSTGSLK